MTDPAGEKICAQAKTCPAFDKPFTKRPKITPEVWTGQVYCSKVSAVHRDCKGSHIALSITSKLTPGHRRPTGHS